MRKIQQKKEGRIIPFRQSLFWDVDPKTIDPKKNAPYIIERMLELGTDDEVRWMWSYYPHELVRNVLEHRRGIRPKVKPLWITLTTETK